MSLVDYLHDNRTPMELAKELARSAHENAALRDKLGAAELELFWMKAAERETVTQAIAAPAVAQVGVSLLRPEISSANQLPPGCHCKVGQCGAPKPAWCRDHAKRDGLAATQSNKGE